MRLLRTLLFIRASTTTALRGPTILSLVLSSSQQQQTTRRNMISTTNDYLASNTNNTWEEKVEILSSKSQAFQSLSLEDRLELVDAILLNAKASLGNDGMYEQEMAVLKLSPTLESSSSSFSTEVKRILGFNKYGTVFLIMNTLWHIKKKLKYEIARQNAKESGNSVKKPVLLRKVKQEVIDGKQINIHGPVEIFPVFHKLEVWSDASSTIASTATYKKVDDSGGICLVLGGGNQSFIALYDTIHCLFNHPSTKPVLIKHHPLRPYLYPICAQLFAPLIEAGFVDQIVDGGMPETSLILQHPTVQHVHLTGALSTAQAIEKTMAQSRPDKSEEEIQSMITSELGCVTPFIISPGRYSRSELRMTAKHIVTGKKVNGGSNCNCVQAVILPQGWAQKEEFREILVSMMRKIPTSPCYYPGSKSKVQDIVNKYNGNTERPVLQPQSKRVQRNSAGGIGDDDYLQPFLVDCGTYGDQDYNNHALTNEAFGPLLALVELPGDVGDTYLSETAVPFVNNKDNIYGSLSCSLIYPKKYDKDIIRAATANLNYGCIALNTWSLYGFFGGLAFGGTWGGSSMDPSGQSGSGFAGNIFAIPNVTKSVVSSRSLTFPLIYDLTLIPPKFLSGFASSLYFLKNPFRSCFRGRKSKAN